MKNIFHFFAFGRQGSISVLPDPVNSERAVYT